MFHTFIPTQYMKENVLLCSNLDRYDVKRIYLGSSSKAMAGSEKKRGWKYKNSNISSMEKAC